MLGPGDLHLARRREAQLGVPTLKQVGAIAIRNLPTEGGEDTKGSRHRRVMGNPGLFTLARCWRHNDRRSAYATATEAAAGVDN